MGLGQRHKLKDRPDSGQDSPRSRILLVEDHPIVSRALSDLIGHEPDLEVCGIADDHASALRQIGLLRPDLILLDMTLHGRGGLELLKDIKAQYPKPLILMLSMHEETLYAARTIRAGANGYIMKQEATQSLLGAIRRVLQGEIFLSPLMERRVMQRLACGGSALNFDPFEVLTDRELEIFRLIGRGNATREIARLLCLSTKTVESHRAHIKLKLNLKKASELVQHAIQTEREAGGIPGAG